MTPLDRYLRTLTAIREGADEITSAAKHLGMLRPTVETHFRWLTEHRYVQGVRTARNLPATYTVTRAGRAWLKAVTMAEAQDEAPPAPIIGEEDESIAAKLYLWLRLSPPKPHSVRGRIHRLLDQGNSAESLTDPFAGI